MSNRRPQFLLLSALLLSFVLPLTAGCGKTQSEAQDQAKVEALKQSKLKSDK